MRAAIVVQILAISLVFSGCLTVTDGTETVETTNATNLSVIGGEDRNIELRFQDINGLRIAEPENGSRDPEEVVDYSEIELTPRRYIDWNVDPPSWSWQSNESVKAVIPVRTERNTSKGIYRFTFVARDGEERRKPIRIRVKG